MAWPNSQQRRVKLTVQNGQVSGSGTHSDFPVLITRDNLPDEICSPTDSNRAQSLGGDIRAGVDQDCNTQLPIEIVSFEYDTSDGAGNANIEIWVKLDLNTASDTDFYLGYNTSGTTSADGVADTYGRNAVWEDVYHAVYHMNEDPSGSAPQIIDSVGDYDLTSNGSMTSDDLVSGKVGQGIDFDGADDYLENTSFPAITEPFSILAWFNADVWNSSYRSLVSIGGVFDNDAIFDVGVRESGAEERFYAYWRNGGTLYGSEKAVGAGTDAGQDIHFAAVVDTSHSLELFEDAGSIGTDANAAAGSDGSHALRLGAWSGTQSSSSEYDGVISQLEIAKVELSSDWIATEYANQNSPGTFIVEGTPEDVGGGGGTDSWPSPLAFLTIGVG